MTLDLKALLTTDVPLIDVRAPVEFSQGAFPGAVNLPILNDDERHRVGVCYKQKGPDAAEKLGHELVSGEVRKTRLTAWQSCLDQYPNAHLYCFRGGKRSQLAVEWLQASGYEVTRIVGGYKALRSCLLSVFDQLPPLVVLAGKTGNGKTDLLANLTRMVDLEGHANHRGSAFGRQLAPQPAQIDFENAVAINLLKLGQGAEDRPVVVDDEGRLIGRVSLPLHLQQAMKQAPLVLLEGAMEDRVERIFGEYILGQYEQLLSKLVDPALALDAHSAMFFEGLKGIKRRLGGVEHDRLQTTMQCAFAAQAKGYFQQHRDCIRALLSLYYDPMYAYQIDRKADRIIFRGDFPSVTEYLQTLELKAP